MVIFLVLNNNSELAWLAPRPCSKRLVQAVVFCLRIVLHFLTALSSSSSSSNVESLFSGGKWMTMWTHLRPKNKVCTFWYRYYYSWVNNRVTHCINCYSAAPFKLPSSSSLYFSARECFKCCTLSVAYTVVMDVTSVTVTVFKVENLLWSGLQWHRSCHSNEMTLLPILRTAVYIGTGNCSSKIINAAFSSNIRPDVREVWEKSVRALSRYFRIKILWLEIR